MPKMIDMGYKSKKDEGPQVIGPGSGDKIQYPTLHISKKIPEDLRDKKIDEMCRIEIVGRIASISKDEYGESIGIEIQKMGYIGKGGKVTKEEYMDMSDEKREEYDRSDTKVDEEEKEEKKEDDD